MLFLDEFLLHSLSNVSLVPSGGPVNGASSSVPIRLPQVL